MEMSIRKRMALGAGAVATVGAVATLVAGVTFGLFSATAQNSSPANFTSGTVSTSHAAGDTCVIPAHVVPGDTGSCTFHVTFTGNVSSFVGLSTSTTGALYDGTASDDSGANKLVVSITDGTTTFGNSTADMYVSTDSANPTAHTFTVNWSLPSGADNSYQNQSASVGLTVKAVQSAHNGSCSTAGSACSGTNWS